MADEAYQPDHGWQNKFRHAFRGIALGVGGERSFAVHLPAAAAVVVCGMLLRVGRTEWGLLILCIAVVLSAELFNSALERLAAAVDRKPNPQLGAALDIASAAVLTAACGAAVVGLVVFLPHLIALWKAVT